MNWRFKLSKRLSLLKGLLAALVLGACSGVGDSPTAVPLDSEEDIRLRPVTTITITPATTPVRLRWTRQLTATLKDARGRTVNRVVTWTSSNSAVARVSATGLVTGVELGSATITAHAEAVSSTASISVVTAPVFRVGVTPGEALVTVGDTVQLSASVKDSLGYTLYRTVTWSSSNNAIATVSAAGLVITRAAGSATITATSEGRSGMATVTASSSGWPPPPPPPPPAPAAGEPVFTPGLDTSLLGSKDGSFDSYTVASNLTQAGWQFNGTVATPGRGGSGRAARLNYVPLGTNQEPMQYLAASWSRRANVVVSFWFRTSPDADPTSGRFGQSGFKWLILQRDANAGDPNGRITAGVHSLQQGFQYGTPDAGVQFTLNDQSVAAGGFWQNMTRNVGWSTVNQMGTTQRQRSVNDGNWHRYTLHANPLTNTVHVWVDGVLIICSSGLNYPMFDQGWDQVGFGQNVVPDLLAGWQFTVDYDDVQVFVRP